MMKAKQYIAISLNAVCLRQRTTWAPVNYLQIILVLYIQAFCGSYGYGDQVIKKTSTKLFQSQNFRCRPETPPVFDRKNHCHFHAVIWAVIYFLFLFFGGGFYILELETLSDLATRSGSMTTDRL